MKSRGFRSATLGLVDETHEHGLLIPMMEQSEETTGTRTAMTLADSGYFAGSALEECCKRGQQVVVPEKREKHLDDDPYHKDRFVHDEATDTYTCPPRAEAPLFLDASCRFGGDVPPKARCR